MKSKKVIVPRLLVKHYLPHPEFYGEILAELLNGMVTDIFTDEDYNLFTLSNDSKMIKYINHNQVNDQTFLLEDDFIRLRSVTQNDIITVLSWMNKNRTLENVYLYNDIKLYLSHSISSKSHLFIIDKSKIEIGLIGFDIIESAAIININIYEKKGVENIDYDRVLYTLLKHIHNNYIVNEVMCSVANDDFDVHKLLIRNHFKTTNKLNDPDESIYRLNILEIMITEHERRILNDFYRLRPEKLFSYSNNDDLFDLEHSIDYSLKTYISLIFQNQLNKKDNYEEIHLDDLGYLSIESNLLERYDQLLILLKGEDLEIALSYRALINPVITIIKRQIKLYESKILICASNEIK